MKEKKVFFFDIDGTLIESSLGIYYVPHEVKEQLKRLNELGYETILASGIPRALINEDILSAGFSGMVLCNGAYVELHGHTTYLDLPDQDVIFKLVKDLRACGCEHIIETASQSFIEPSYETVIRTFVREDVNHQSFIYNFDLDDLYGSILKLELIMNERNVQIVRDMIPDALSYDGYGTDFFMEIFAKGSTKAKGIEIVLDTLSVDVENAWAFGDGKNDFDMIRYVGHGVAMGNACSELKEIADEICKPIDENGLAEYLSKIK